MALPIIPIAMAAGAVALVRNVQISPVIQDVEDSLDTVEEGLAAHRTPEGDQMNAAYRWRRIIRIGANGPGVEIDASALARIRFRRIH